MITLFRTSGLKFQTTITLHVSNNKQHEHLASLFPNKELYCLGYCMPIAFLKESLIYLQTLSYSKPKGNTVTQRRGITSANDREFLSKHNDILYFKHTQSLENGLPLPDCQSRCHCKLCSLMTPDWETLWGKSTKENSSSSWQVGLFTNYLFPSIRHTGDFTCICSTMLCCSLLFTSHSSLQLIS